MDTNDKHNELTHSFILLLTAIIWGTSFVAQSAGMKVAGPVIYNCIRLFLGGGALIPVILIRNKIFRSRDIPVLSAANSIRKGIVTGIILCIASNLQNIAMIDASAGKAGFMTALYIILVPVIGMFIGRKTSLLTWLGVILALAGLYFLCIGRGGRLAFASSDILLIGCALFFSFHILYVDSVSSETDGLTLSCTQFLTAAVISIPFIFIVDILILGIYPSFASLRSAFLPIAYSGFISCSVAYTLQIIGQKGVNPTLASLIMSLESVVSAISGLIILDQRMSEDEVIGCIAMFAAVVLAQLPAPEKKQHTMRGINENG